MELLDKDEITFEDLEQYNNRAYNSYKYTALNKCKVSESVKAYLISHYSFLFRTAAEHSRLKHLRTT